MTSPLDAAVPNGRIIIDEWMGKVRKTVGAPVSHWNRIHAFEESLIQV